MSKAVAKVEATDVVQASETAPVLNMLNRILTDSSIPIERLEASFSFYERVQAHEARKAFDAAIAAAKSEIPVIAKNKLVDYTSQKGRTTYRHEDLAEISRTVDPILAKHGLSYRFRTKTDQAVSVTCVISHTNGHFEENTLSAGRDASGGKNDIQAIGSTVTYLQRYTLKASLGLSAASDDDGKKADPGETISEAQFKELADLIRETDSTVEAFCAHIKVESLSDILASKFEAARGILLAKKKAMKR